MKIDTAQGALLGLALGDALGTTLEFKTKDSYQHITDIVGGGPFKLKPGQWTDDTAMMLCLGKSLLITGHNDLDDQMNRYVDWYKNGTNSCTGHCFDIGNTVRNALTSFTKTGVAIAGSEDKYSAGNGSLMRTAPIALAFYDSHFTTLKTASYLSSSTTHGEKRCLNACELMNYFLFTLLKRDKAINKQTLLSLPQAFIDNVVIDWHEDIKEIALGSYKEKHRDDINGSGFVVESIEAALWCFYHSNDFKEGALLAANLGDDADTTAAIYGQLAGAFYGVTQLPSDWLEILAWRDEIAQLAVDLVTMPNNEVIRDFLLKNLNILQHHSPDVQNETLLSFNSRDELISTLVNSAYEFNIVLTEFDWPEWAERFTRKVRMHSFQEWLSDADRVECIKYLTMHIRQDRFSDGYIEKVILSKELPQVLHKLMCTSQNQDIQEQHVESDFF
ncbi:ADP-ribosylglycohydrolase family protein [Shewanella sp. 10N.286.51.B8]|uniref:ADP-ribosylglycohydrolase family protein n=1 Tax=Shewanella sp. 10N.286.51.B8 TaxID=3229708 RepID=UPI00354C1227